MLYRLHHLSEDFVSVMMILIAEIYKKTAQIVIMLRLCCDYVQSTDCRGGSSTRTLYLHTFVLSIPYPPLNATYNSISFSLPLPSGVLLKWWVYANGRGKRPEGTLLIYDRWGEYRLSKPPRRLVYAVYPRIPPNTPLPLPSSHPVPAPPIRSQDFGAI